LTHNLKCFIRVGAGYDNVRLDLAEYFQTPVSNIPDYGVDDVADHTVAMILSLVRGLQYQNFRVMEDNWSWPYEPMKRIKNMSCGIVGFGRIGQAVCKRLQAFGMHIYFYDPYVARGVEKVWDVDRVESFEDLLHKGVDVLTFHCPLTDETRYMFNMNTLKHIHNPLILINTARGGIVDTEAVLEGFGPQIDKFGLDVCEAEPPMFLVEQINEMQIEDTTDIIITPHMAFYNQQSFEEMRRKACQECIRYLKSEDPFYRIA